MEKKEEYDMSMEKKRRKLLEMDDRALIDRILAYPDRKRLNYDEEGKRRKYPSAEMAARARRSLAKHPAWKISEKQRFAMVQSFAMHSMDELKVTGIRSINADPGNLMKEEVWKEGTRTTYDMQFHLIPEPDNQKDKNAVAVYADNMEGKQVKIGYVPASYTETHQIMKPTDVSGALTDYSNGKFKNVSYIIRVDTEVIDKELAAEEA